MRICSCVAGIALLCLVLPAESADRPVDSLFRAVRCEGAYPRHLQGIATDDREAIFWCFTVALVKTDASGRVVKQIAVANHHGDLCHFRGRLYVAVNLGKFNQPAGQADSWVYVYDAQTLAELARHRTAEVVHGAGGIACDGSRFLVVGGLPAGIQENYLYEYDLDLRFRRRHALKCGYTLMGIQTATFAAGQWWFGCYGSPATLLRADASLGYLGRQNLDASVGIVGLTDGRLLVARGGFTKGQGYSGRLVPATADRQLGLRVPELMDGPQSR